ncbi:MAG: tetratricopeptide repeat protein [Azonexus sp.]|jgi:Flp pilus assembly protein TadD|uniref:tetratricopeptide repeat protein n=1 Tax=Azonexus sp. TaxID=1872668 RepID=UPI0028324605|nr:tetratricopeptide repeat protein [Azonexus sp.]MDR0777370.1 tetratricopeptide repeat protein [Azonexus sp.]
MSKKKWLVSFLAIGISVLSGCASNKLVMTKEEFVQAMSQSGAQVDALLEKGESGEAVTVLADLAKRNPDRKEPWGRMAKIQFDSGNYAQAIVSAEEVLQRDNTDRTAKSIRAVAGLRVASQSLADLRNDVELKGNARADAASLAAVMRETLGEDVLVPPAELEARKKREAAAAAARAKARAKPASVIAPDDEKQPARGGDPFSQLK